MKAVERRAAAAVEARAAELADAVAAVVPGVRVTRAGGEVIVAGRGLARRVLDEPGLRDPAGLLR